MTTSAFPHDPQCSPGRGGDDPLGLRRPVRIADPGTLISAVPALLGFRPRRSLVAICLRGTTVGAVMRHDLLWPSDHGPDRMDLVLEQFASVAARDGADRMLAVMIDDRVPHRARAADLTRHATLADTFDVVLRTRGIELAAVHVCARIEAGAPWHDVGGSLHGVLPDPGASVVAAAQVLGGRAIRGSREELEEVLSPAPPHVRARVADLIDARRDATVHGDARGAAPAGFAGPAVAGRAALEAVLTRIAFLECGEELCDQDFVEAALALENPAVRDSLLALSAGVQADAADQMWIRLARTLPEPECAEPLALLGYSAYLRGDGPMAGIALGAALDADPGHRLATLLDDALQAGMRPDALRDLAEVGHQVAADLGVVLPPIGPLPAGGV